jgi:hypothetical protein
VGFAGRWLMLCAPVSAELVTPRERISNNLLYSTGIILMLVFLIFCGHEDDFGWVIPDSLPSTNVCDALPVCGILHSNTWHHLCAMFADIPSTKHNAVCCAVVA